MAYSTQRAVSDGTLQLLMLSIEFFDKSEISVYLDNVPTTAFTWATDKSIHFNSVVPLGVEALIRRTTDISQVRHVFSLGAQFKDSTLDDDFRQILHIAQEAVEGANVGDIYSTLNMHGNKITNVGLATDDGDAISLGQVRTESAGAFVATAQAQAAAAQALSSANAAGASAGTANTARVDAEGARDLALTYRDSASSSASTATSQAGLANTARVGAESAQTAANNSATLAQRWAAELEDVVVSGGLYSSYHYSRKAAASAAAAAASAAAAVGVGPGYITGLLMTWTSANSITVSAGSAYIPASGAMLNVASAITVAGITMTASTHYYVYLYSNAGTPAIEISATAPTIYHGSAAIKTGDNTRRYVGPLLCTSTANTIQRFTHKEPDTIRYSGNLTASPFQVANAAPLTQVTAICSTVVPVSGTYAICNILNPGTGAVGLFANPDVVPTVLFANHQAYVGPASGFTGELELSAARTFIWVHSAASTMLLQVFVYGFRFNR